jgi:hypothetical protein
MASFTHSTDANASKTALSAVLFGLVIAFALFCGCKSRNGSIQVNSTPAGAAVWLDSENTGKTTDCLLEAVRAGEHTVKLKLAGYKDWTRSITVGAGQTESLNAVMMVPMRGSIQVNSTPTGAAVLLDSVYTDKTTNCLLESVPAGEHSITLRLLWYLGWDSTVTVFEGQMTTVNVRLAAGPGWMRTYGLGEGLSVQQTSDGGYIVAGYIEPSSAVYLIKTDANGDTVWTRAFGGTGCFGDGCCVRQTSDGGYIVTGDFTGDVFLIKTDANGDTVWTRTCGGAGNVEGRSVQQTSDGGYIVTGGTVPDTSGCDACLIKTDANGDTVWSRTYGGAGQDEGYAVQQTSDGGYIVAGAVTPDTSFWSDACLIKTDANGDTVWTRTYGGADLDWGSSVQQTWDGGYVIAVNYTTGMYGQGYIVKTDARGGPLWTDTVGLNANAVQQTSDRAYIVTGWSYLVKIGANGDVLWVSPLLEAMGNSAQQTSDGGYIVTGWFEPYPSGARDIFLIKTDANGNWWPPPQGSRSWSSRAGALPGRVDSVIDLPVPPAPRLHVRTGHGHPQVVPPRRPHRDRP